MPLSIVIGAWPCDRFLRSYLIDRINPRSCPLAVLLDLLPFHLSQFSSGRIRRRLFNESGRITKLGPMSLFDNLSVSCGYDVHLIRARAALDTNELHPMRGRIHPKTIDRSNRFTAFVDDGASSQLLRVHLVQRIKED